MCLAHHVGVARGGSQSVDGSGQAAPILADIEVDGEPVAAIVQITKQGFAFVLDRATGEPVWPIVERRVPASPVPGEQASPTQPFPTRPPPFEQQGVTVDDLIGFTPGLREEAIEIAERYVLGPLFMPPTLPDEESGGTLGTLVTPSSTGGANWNGAAFDPETGRLYIPSVTGTYVADLQPGSEGNLELVPTTRAFIEGPRGLPLLKPPYGRITAIDLNEGEIDWQVPNGDGPRFHPEIAHLNLPPLGQPGRGTPLVTRTLLFVSEGDAIQVRTPPGGGGRMLRAFDKVTGEVVWETELDAGTTGAAMTYLHEGKQYIVVAIGGQDHPAEFIALSLP